MCFEACVGGDWSASPFRPLRPFPGSADDTAAVRFPRLLVEHLGLSAQVVRSVHQFIQPYPSLQHVVDRSVLGLCHRGNGVARHAIRAGTRTQRRTAREYAEYDNRYP